MVEISQGLSKLQRWYYTYPLTNLISQAALSIVVLSVYVTSISGELLPFHGCWVTSTYFLPVEFDLRFAF